MPELLSADMGGYEATTGPWVDQSNHTVSGTNGNLTRTTTLQKSGAGGGQWALLTASLVIVSNTPLVGVTGGRIYRVGGYLRADPGNSGFLGCSSVLNWSSTTASVTTISSPNVQAFLNPPAGAWTQYGMAQMRAPITATGFEWVWNPQGANGNIVYNDDNVFTSMFNTLYLSTDAADAGVTVSAGTKKKATNDLPGGSSTVANINAVLGATTGVQYTDSTVVGTNGTAISWYSEPLRKVTIAGSIQWQFFGIESVATANAAPSIQVERCDNVGNILSVIVAKGTNQGALEYLTTAGGTTKTGTIATPTSTTLTDGDRLRITVWIDDAVDQGGSGTMASGGNTQFWYGANTGQGLAQVSFAELLTPLLPPRLLQPTARFRAVTY